MTFFVACNSMEQESYGKIWEDIMQATDLDKKTTGYIEPRAEFKLAESE